MLFRSVKHQINYDGLVSSLKKGKSKAKIDKKRMGKGTRMSLPPVDVLWVNCEDWLDDEIEAEITAGSDSETESRSST